MNREALSARERLQVYSNCFFEQKTTRRRCSIQFHEDQINIRLFDVDHCLHVIYGDGITEDVVFPIIRRVFKEYVVVDVHLTHMPFQAHANEFFGFLKDSDRLTYLTLADASLVRGGISHLCDALVDGLPELNILAVKVSDLPRGAHQELCEAIGARRKLEYLSLEALPDDVEITRTYFEMIKRSGIIKIYMITRRAFDAGSHMSLICNMIEHSTIETLGLEIANMEDSDFISLGAAIYKNKQFSSLELGGELRRLTPVGVRGFIESIGYHRSFRSLYMHTGNDSDGLNRLLTEWFGRMKTWDGKRTLIMVVFYYWMMKGTGGKFRLTHDLTHTLDTYL